MSLRFRFLLASLALAATTLVRAESASAAPAPVRAPNPILATLDTNHDGTLSAGELAAAPLTLTALDLNEDGTISPAERTVDAEGRAVRTRRGGSSFNVVLALDANHDGALQSLEVAHAASSLKRLDVNGDGRLTPDELRTVTLARN
jgi:hypothetical protein